MLCPCELRRAACLTAALMATGPPGATAGLCAICQRRGILRATAAHPFARAPHAHAAARWLAACCAEARVCAGGVQPAGEARAQAPAESPADWLGAGNAPVCRRRLTVLQQSRVASCDHAVICARLQRTLCRPCSSIHEASWRRAGLMCAWCWARRCRLRTWRGCRLHSLALACSSAAQALSSCVQRPP